MGDKALYLRGDDSICITDIQSILFVIVWFLKSIYKCNYYKSLFINMIQLDFSNCYRITHVNYIVMYIYLPQHPPQQGQHTLDAEPMLI